MPSHTITTDEYNYHPKDPDFVDLEAQNKASESIKCLCPSLTNPANMQSLMNTLIKTVSFMIWLACIIAVFVLHSGFGINISSLFQRQLLSQATRIENSGSEYQMLNGVVQYEGKDVRTSPVQLSGMGILSRIHTGHQQKFLNGVDVCNKECSKNNRCQSYAVCFWADSTQCWLKDMLIPNNPSMLRNNAGKETCFSVKRTQNITGTSVSTTVASSISGNKGKDVVVFGEPLHPGWIDHKAAEDSGYKMLSGLLQDEGEQADRKTHGVALNLQITASNAGKVMAPSKDQFKELFPNGIITCNSECNQNNQCRSYAVCFSSTGLKCWLKKKVITDDTAMTMRSSTDCFSVQRTRFPHMNSTNDSPIANIQEPAIQDTIVSTSVAGTRQTQTALMAQQPNVIAQIPQITKCERQCDVHRSEKCCEELVPSEGPRELHWTNSKREWKCVEVNEYEYRTNCEQ